VNVPAIWNFRRRLTKTIKASVPGSVIGQLVGLETTYEMLRNSAAQAIPGLLTPSPKFLTMAITAKCNLRCQGCRYGRDYMVGQQLPTKMAMAALKDAAAAGMSTVRLYGGEPFLHPDLPSMIRECCSLGMTPFVSTNGLMLEKRLDSVFDAGLRILTFGYYGYGPCYDSYVGAKGAWERFENGIIQARDRYGNLLKLSICYVLNTRTCSLEELERAWIFAKRYDLELRVDLVHYSLPYFTEGPDRELQFKESDGPRIHKFVGELEKLKRERPDLYKEPLVSIRSIPDWLLKGPEMRVPCDAYNMIWIGADGSVRLCFVTFPLGNLYEKPLSSMLFGEAHKGACKSALALKCPNCHCARDTRISKHLVSLVRYSRPAHHDEFGVTDIAGEPFMETKAPTPNIPLAFPNQNVR
jgi:cyclic pyranopterin phosphate synthase